MKRFCITMAAALLFAAPANTASAMGRCGHGCGYTSCGDCGYGGGCGSGYAGCGAPAAPCGPQYMTVQRAIQRMVPVVTEKEIEVTEYTYRTRNVEQSFTSYKQVTREEVRKATQYRMECVQQVQQRTVCVPVTKTVNQEVTYCVPVTTKEERTRYSTTYKQESQVVMQKVCSL